MLTEERYEAILAITSERRSVSVQELTAELGVSESTIRRDLTALDRAGKLHKVFGGAVSSNSVNFSKELSIKEKSLLHYDAKNAIALYAATLIAPSDFVYIDAGTTTKLLAECIEETQATYVTNSMEHALTLCRKGCHTIILGGQLKQVTEAVIGVGAIETLGKFNFTVGFFGTNGVDDEHGFTTPDIAEAAVKKAALERCEKRYVLCDSSKFHLVAPITFADFESAQIITDQVPGHRYQKYDHIKEVRKI